MNFKHLYYFWVTAKSGGIMRAGEQLHTTPKLCQGKSNCWKTGWVANCSAKVAANWS